MNQIKHPFDPLFNGESKTLILGSFPSVKSRERQFYYAHPQNRFWPVIAAIFEENTPNTVEEKRALILRNHLALWDTIASCEIAGSSDASIRNVKPNDISVILDMCEITGIYCNGQRSYQYYRRFIQPVTQRGAVCLPSTSPANARWSLKRLIAAWSVIRGEDLHNGPDSYGAVARIRPE